MRNMYLSEKIAIWIFIRRTKRHLLKLKELEPSSTNLYQLELLHRAYSKMLDSVIDVRKWGENLNPRLRWVTLGWFVKNKLVQLENQVNANK